MMAVSVAIRTLFELIPLLSIVSSQSFLDAGKGSLDLSHSHFGALTSKTSSTAEAAGIAYDFASRPQ